MVALRQLHAPVDSVLCFLHRPAEVTTPDAELDRQVPLVVFAIDVGGPRCHLYIRQIAEWYYSPGRRLDRNVLYALDAIAISRHQADDEREVTFLLEYVGGGLSTNCGLHHGIDVTRRETVPSRAFAIDFHQNVGLTQLLEDTCILYTANRRDGLLNPVTKFFELVEIVAEQLDGVLSFDSGNRFLDVVFDGLRKIEVDSWKRLLKL